MTIDWAFPVYTPETRGEGTSSAPVRKALPRDEAFKLVAGDDLRPLLVLREFDSFDAPDNEKLSRMLYTEETVVLSHWFRCVRLPHHVAETDHPFHALFAGDDAPQMFFATHDGTVVDSFDHTKRGADLEETMLEMIEQTYTKSAAKSCDHLVKLLPTFDNLDRAIARLKEEVDQALETDGPKDSKTRKLQKKLAQAEDKRATLLAKQDELRAIPLKAE